MIDMNDWYAVVCGLGATMIIMLFSFMILSIIKELTDEEDTEK